MGELELCYETFGAAEAPPLLLVMGLASQMILWDEDFCQSLAAEGFRVIRFDNRDVGRSTIMRGSRIPRRWQLLTRDARGAAYSLDEMAADAVGLLDHLGIGAAHIVGASMGGMIAQLIALQHPDRVLSLVSIMSTTGNRRVGRPQTRTALRLLRRPRTDREGYIEDFLETFRTIGSRRYPRDPVYMRALAQRCFDRGVHPAGAARQLAAILTTADRTPRLRTLKLPTTVIHGTDDRLVMPSGGRATAAAIPGARLAMIDRMAHDLPAQLWPQVIDEITRTAGILEEETT